MATKKTQFEKTWNRKEKDGANIKNRFLARKYWLAALKWSENINVEEGINEIEALEAE
jgi:hypothetical protein